MLTKPEWGPGPEQVTNDKLNEGIDYGQTIHGRAVADTAPTDEQALVWNETTQTWEPGDVADGGAHTHVLADITDAGSAAALDAPAAGDAAAGEVMLGSDSRNTNSRTPTSHAATHRPGGSDAIPTAAAAGLANANAEGGSTSLARADHTHKRDVRVLQAAVAVGIRNALNFTGAGVSATDDAANDRVNIDIPGGGAGSDAKVEVYSAGVQVGTVARKLDLDGDDFVVTEDGANDQFDVALADELDSKARVAVRVNSDASDTGARRRLNLIEGSGISIIAGDDAGDEEIDVTIAATGGGGGGHLVQDEGAPLTARSNLNFEGAAVAATDDAGNNATKVTVDAVVPGGVSGGQNIRGGTGSGERLKLNGSSHATKGPVQLADEGGNVVIGTGDGNYIATSWKALTIHEATGGAVVEMASSRAEADAAIISRYAQAYTPYTNKFIADIRLLLSGTTAGNRGASWQFLVKPDGSASPLEAMRITHNRALLLGRTTGLIGLGDLDANGHIRTGKQVMFLHGTLTTPEASHTSLGVKSDGLLYTRNSAGTETLIRTPRVSTLTDAATIATNAALSETFNISSATSRTLGVPTNAADGMKRVWRYENTSGSAITLTLASGAGGFAFGSNVTSIPATAAGKTTVIGAIFNSSANRWQVVAHDVF